MRKLVEFLEHNKPLVPIQMSFLAFNFGFSLLWPFLNLQMRTLGLTYEDISFVVGLTPFVTFFSTPFLGLLGDRISHKMILILDLVIMMLTSTSFLYLPKYKEFTLAARVLVQQAVNSSEFQMLSIEWPLASCNQDDYAVNECQNDYPVTDPDFLANLANFTRCSNQADRIEFEDAEITNVTVISTKNGTMCSATSEFFQIPQSNAFWCDLQNEQLATCLRTEGDHRTTFWIYFCVRLLFDIFMNSAFCLLDGTALKQAKQYKSNYAYIALFLQIGSTLGTLCSGFLVDDSAEANGGDSNYAALIFGGDIFYVVTIALVLFVKISMTDVEKNENMIKSFSKVINMSTLIMFVFVLCRGINMGVEQTYQVLYLQEELNASPELIGSMSSVAGAAGIISAIFAKPLIKYCGAMNLVYSGLLLAGVRAMVYSEATQSPPYFALGLATFDFLTGGFSTICLNSHGYTLVPSYLAGTIASVIAIMQYMLGKSIGALGSGQIVEKTPLDIPDLFKVQAGVTVGLSTITFAFYKLYGFKYDDKVREKLIQPDNNNQENEFIKQTEET